MTRIVATIITGVVLACAAQVAHAQQLTTLAVVDLQKVANTFYADSQAVRDLQKKADDLRSQIAQQKQDIQDLQNQRLQAQNQGDQSRALQLEDQITQKQRYLEEFQRIKQDELNQQYKSITQAGSPFYNQMYQAVVYVAQSKGYTVVLYKSDPSLAWWAPSVDITDQVIEYLRKSNNS